MAKSLRVKVYFGDEIRSVTIPEDTSLLEFLQLLKNVCPQKFENENPVFMYQDDEGDWVTFTTDTEWQEALKYRKDKATLRLKVKQKIEEKKKIKRRCKLQRACDGRWAFPTKPGDYVLDITPAFEKGMKGGIHKILKTVEKDLEPFEVIHHNIICDGCGERNIRGLRFKCNQCDDFDFCEKCYAKRLSHFSGKHTFTKYEKSVHPFFKIPGLNVVAHVIDERKKPRKEKKEQPKEQPKEQKVEKVEKKEEIKKQEEKKVEVEKVQPKVEEIKPEPLKPVIVKTEVKPVEEPQPKPSAPPADIKVEPAVEVKTEPVQTEIKLEPAENDIPPQYRVHFQILESMGFTNKELNLFLLKKHNGNLQRVVDECINYSNK